MILNIGVDGEVELGEFYDVRVVGIFEFGEEVVYLGWFVFVGFWCIYFGEEDWFWVDCV